MIYNVPDPNSEVSPGVMKTEKGEKKEGNIGLFSKKKKKEKKQGKKQANSLAFEIPGQKKSVDVSKEKEKEAVQEIGETLLADDSEASLFMPYLIDKKTNSQIPINKKDFNAAKIAAAAYWKLFILWYKDEDNIGTIDMICRAVCISVQTKQTAIYNEIQGWFNDFIFTKASSDESGFALRVMELFFEQKNFDVSIILNALDELIAYNSANVAKVEQAYKLRAKCLSKLKRKKEERQNNILLADYYLDFAEKTLQKDIQGAWRAVNFYQKGIILYRNNGKPEKASAAQKRLIEIQKEIPKTMMPISIKLDIKGVVDNIMARACLKNILSCSF